MATNLDGLRQGITAYGEQVARAGIEQIRDVLEVVAPRDTGELARSWFWTDNGLTHTIGYTAPQAGYTNDGTGAHVIEGNPLLVFYWPKVGRVVHLRSVAHPGSTIHKGWFDDEVTPEAWDDALRRGVDDVGVYAA